MEIEFYNLPETAVKEELVKLKAEQIIDRIWNRDHTAWNENPKEISNRLGWLQSHRLMLEEIPGLEGFVKELQAEGFTQALLLGMGGSSMAPEVFRKVFGIKDGYLDLHILDTTDPDAIAETENRLDLKTTLVIVATKSGGTVETISLMKYFYNRMAKTVGAAMVGNSFVAITDPGSGLEDDAGKLNFRKVFLNDPGIGGRYSALSYFGIVPAAIVGVDLKRLLFRSGAVEMSSKTPTLPPAGGNSPAWLGAVLGCLGKMGRDKVTFISSPEIEPFEAWVEQLIAESTGKEGTGLLPVCGEIPGSPGVYAEDRVFIYTRLKKDSIHDQKVKALVEAGQPVIQLNLLDQYSLGGEYFRWMMATAVAGWALNINPFDQPNVESAKVLAREMISGYQQEGKLPSSSPDLEEEGLQVYGAAGSANLQQALQSFLGQAEKGEENCRGRSYISIQAYLKPAPEAGQALQELQTSLRDKTLMAVTSGYGPRFLHSTGQLHKGDAGRGLFIQLTADPQTDLPIPEEAGSDKSNISFGILKEAQALGDRQALIDGGRRVLRIHLTGEHADAIRKIVQSL